MLRRQILREGSALLEAASVCVGFSGFPVSRSVHATAQSASGFNPPHRSSPTPLRSSAPRHHAFGSLDPLLSATSATRETQLVTNALAVAVLIDRFRDKGHEIATLDPLGRPPGSRGPYLSDETLLPSRDHPINWHPTLFTLVQNYPFLHDRAARHGYLHQALDMASGLGENDRIPLPGVLRAPSPDGDDSWYLVDLFEFLYHRYCGTLTAETAHMNRSSQASWIHEKIEQHESVPPSTQRDILYSLIRTTAFENILKTGFPASKRFGIEGCEALIPGLIAIARKSSELGVTRIELGMAHRGRLNVLHQLVGKDLGQICSEMEGESSEVHVGDVKYHLGNMGTYTFLPSWAPREGGRTDELGRAGRPETRELARSVRLNLAPNPSHLEAISPVIAGMVRAQQARLRSLRTTEERMGRILGLIIHGDAAFSGLGSVYELLSMGSTDGYHTGGTIHVVVNNQVGFTTCPTQARSGVHATDLAKAVGAPILHANADDPEAVWRACEIAAEYRLKFRADVVVDIVGYRRHGHNELDDPSPGLPLTSARVATHPPVATTYAQHLVGSGSDVVDAEIQEWSKAVETEYTAAWDAYKQGAFTNAEHEWVTSTWQGDALKSIASEGDDTMWKQEKTGLPFPTLQWMGERLTTLPQGFRAHEYIEKLFAKRRAMVETPESRVDWAMAEQLAFAALALHQGVRPPNWDESDDQAISREIANDPASGLNRGHYRIRLSGQDVERGTFNQRHCVIYDQDTADRYYPLQHVTNRQEPVEIINSPLNESAVLGFEYGYSLGMLKRGLTIWEAQFGDFANNAQVVIDQFITSGEEKWGQESNLVMLLPHGYDGQGPDHSSARLERFLQMQNDDPDHLPGKSPDDLRLIRNTFEQLTSKNKVNYLTRADVAGVLGEIEAESPLSPKEATDVLWSELGLAADANLNAEAWEEMMISYLRRNMEKNTNFFVLQPSTPAQYFHALRRHVNLPFTKPSIMLTPKYLLHHKPCTSAVSDMGTGSFFRRIIDDNNAADNTRHRGSNPTTGELLIVPPSDVKRVVMCSGQIYYKLSQLRRARKIKNVVMVRLEQIAPFPHDKLTSVLQRYPEAEVVWAQEEPKNMGAWNFVAPRLQVALREECKKRQREPRRIIYVGRGASASTATASMSIHLKETKNVLEEALTVGGLS